MADRDGKYTLRLELRDEEGRVMGELQVTLVGDTKPNESDADRESRGHTHRSSGHRRFGHTNGRRENPPRAFRGRDEHPTDARGDRRAMSVEQRKLLFRLAYSLGWTREAAKSKVLETLNVERFEYATRQDASRAIDALKDELAAKEDAPTNGAAHG